MRYVLILMILSSGPLRSQDLAVKDRLAMLSYLANGKIVKSYYRDPSMLRKGTCILEIYCKKGFFKPDSDTVHLLGDFFMGAMGTYVLSDSTAYYDTVGVQFVGFEGGRERRKGWGFLPSRQQFGSLGTDDRLGVILNVLPFKAVAATQNKDSVELILHQIAGYSPFDDLNRFSTVLAFVVFDFVYHRKKKQVIVDFVDDDRQRIIKFIPNMRNIKEFLSSIRKQ